MKLNRFHSIGLLAAACVLLTAETSSAFSFHIDINVAALTTQTGPFSLDFQLNDGSPSSANVVTLSNFTFTGGAATGTATAFEGATGDLFSSVKLDGTAGAFNELYQSFSGTTTSIGFDVNTTELVAPGVTPDLFAVAILDNTFAQLTTTSDNTLDLLEVAYTSTPLSNASVKSFVGTGSAAGVTAVPEPSTYAFIGSGLVGLLAMARRRK